MAPSKGSSIICEFLIYIGRGPCYPQHNMNTKNLKIELIPYHKSLSDEIAEMWNASTGGWNGVSFEATEETVLSQEENSAHIQLQLARVDDVIAGYCKTCIDHWDADTLYIELLNVRDEYHGKKIGKALVKNAVMKAVETGWPRIDLNTWEGNLKAVPLYKKCGFFWEKRDDTTHLINLIPTVLQTELFSDFFKSADWYDDSTREIKVEPDEVKENGFTYWTYSWEKDGKSLEIDFTRRGRGIRRVETDEYIIFSTVAHLECVFGQSYNITYEIMNKSANPLAIEINGRNDRNILFDFDTVCLVEDRKIITAPFEVGVIDRDQPEWKTHPCVTADIKVNGKSVCFKTGITPKAPLSITIKNPKEIPLRSTSRQIYIDLENHNPAFSSFTVSFPATRDAKFVPDVIEVTLEHKEKRSIPVCVELAHNTLYSEKALIEVRNSEYGNYTFSREISASMHTGFGSYSGNSLKGIEMGTGTWWLLASKERINETYIGRVMTGQSSVFITPPRLGKPFGGEFEHELFSKYSIETGNGWICFSCDFSSTVRRGIEFTKYIKLYENGIYERWFEIHNRGSNLQKNVAIADGCYFGRERMVIPYNDKFILIDSDTGLDFTYWEASKFSEPWFFAESVTRTLGFSWGTCHTLRFINNSLTLVHNAGDLPPGETRILEPVYTAIDTFSDWHNLREFSLKKKLPVQKLTPAVELEINNGNPIVDTAYEAVIKSYSITKYDAELTYYPNEYSRYCETKQMEKERWSAFTIEPQEPVTPVKAVMNRNDFKICLRKTVFRTNGKVKSQKNNSRILTTENGCLTIKTDPEFAPSIFALSFKGTELLDTGYPLRKARSWWNPWTGGIISFPAELSMHTVCEEPHTFTFTKQKDNFGNLWEGIKIHTDIKKNEKNRGLSYSQYYLLLPGLPVLLTYCEFRRNGEHSIRTRFETNCFFKGSEDITDLNIRWETNFNTPMAATPGAVLLGTGIRGNLSLRRDPLNICITPFTNSLDEKGHYMDMHLSMLWFNNFVSAEAGETVRTKPNFLIISRDEITSDMLRDLENIDFY